MKKTQKHIGNLFGLQVRCHGRLKISLLKKLNNLALEHPKVTQQVSIAQVQGQTAERDDTRTSAKNENLLTMHVPHAITLA